jgi:hypothetical protein
MWNFFYDEIPPIELYEIICNLQKHNITQRTQGSDILNPYQQTI